MPQMTTRDDLIDAAQALLQKIEQAWQADLGSSVCWFGAEGERVRDNAHEFLLALKTGTEHTLLKGDSLAHYLGEDWVDSHESIHAQAWDLDRKLSKTHGS